MTKPVIARISRVTQFLTISVFGKAALNAVGKAVLATLLVAFVFAQPANADSSSKVLLERLDAFSNNLKTFSADFIQTVYDADSNPLQSSTGTVLLKRPGRFVWNYEAPSEQLIVADGERVWLYDLELEQVTVSALTDQSRGTPLALLMGDTPLDQEFSLRTMGSSDGIDWIELTPLTQDSDFELVFLGLNEKGLAAMELRDNFGQATQIRFENFQSDVPLDDSQFEFIVPEGVDVIGQG